MTLDANAIYAERKEARGGPAASVRDRAAAKFPDPAVVYAMRREARQLRNFAGDDVEDYA